MLLALNVQVNEDHVWHCLSFFVSTHLTLALSPHIIDTSATQRGVTHPREGLFSDPNTAVNVSERRDMTS